MPPELENPVVPAMRRRTIKLGQYRRVSAWQRIRTPAAIMVTFLLGVWVTLVDIEDARMRTSDYSAGSAKLTDAPRPSAVDAMRGLLGLDRRSGVAEGASGRPRPADEHPPVAP